MRCRKRIEEVLGWGKIIAGLAQLKVRGLDKVKAVFAFVMVACNIVRLPMVLWTTGQVSLERRK